MHNTARCPARSVSGRKKTVQSRGIEPFFIYEPCFRRKFYASRTRKSMPRYRVDKTMFLLIVFIRKST